MYDIARCYDREYKGQRVNPEFMIPIQNDWLNKPLRKESFFVTHIIDQFKVDEVMGCSNTYLKAYYFDYVVDEIIKNVIDGNDED